MRLVGSGETSLLLIRVSGAPSDQPSGRGQLPVKTHRSARYALTPAPEVTGAAIKRLLFPLPANGMSQCGAP